ncbi:ANTAR domain-containing protein [Antrihabitans sp. YC2-6]|uniref:ANTAR domain-containing protein n=1 Tax=Antrihabitans sp. YC2-6 TaxID=2799498 RepID=UPI0018F515B6|nr:ANTAR domain-containing protein [Antrihabitans sp. YC2-6]MBJ8347176.1 ANTAR domain-containing protein [Antrihabitans sp. YC2-6]
MNAMSQKPDLDRSDAVRTRSVVDTATGVLMALYGFDADTAYAELARVAHAQEVSVFAIAAALVDLASSTDRAPSVESRRPDLIDPQWREDLSFRSAPRQFDGHR